MIIPALREFGPIHKILGDIEIETIIKRIKGKKLKQTERNYLSRSIRPKLIGAAILSEERILEKISRPKKAINRNQILFNLNYYGYELITPYKIPKQEILAIGELITKILIQLPEARFIEGIPILLIKNRIDPYRLLELAVRYDFKNKIGYLLETSFMIAKRFKLSKKISYLKRLLSYLKATKDKDITSLGEYIEEEYREFLKETSPKRIKEWNLLDRYFDKDFIENAKIYLK